MTNPLPPGAGFFLRSAGAIKAIDLPVAQWYILYGGAEASQAPIPFQSPQLALVVLSVAR